MLAPTFKRSFARQTATAVLMLTACASAFAVSTWDNFNLSDNCGPNTNAGAYTAACTQNLPSGAGSLGLTGLSTGTLVNGQSTITPKFNAAKIYDWGPAYGLGVVSDNESSGPAGPHAIDNKYGTDALLLNFSATTSLNAVKLGWNGTDSPVTNGSYIDSDVSIFAWTGGPSAPILTGNNGVGPATLASAGWTLVGNFFNAGSLTNNTITTGSAIYSSYWLISAYNISYGGTDATSTTNYDAFKVLAISANNCPGVNCPKPPEVPEPSSLALMGAAVMGLAVSRRRKLKLAS